jgi:hypothetical protein
VGLESLCVQFSGSTRWWLPSSLVTDHELYTQVHLPEKLIENKGNFCREKNSEVPGNTPEYLSQQITSTYCT